MRFTLNGREIDVEAQPMSRLLDVLRHECNLTGTKEGCGEGECGACTVLVDDRPVVSCLVPFAHVRERSVTTIEGLDGHPLLAAFAREGAAQCGFCTPGMIVAASVVGADEDARRALAGNLCRCTGYTSILRALERP